jgi:hypothetical protein
MGGGTVILTFNYEELRALAAGAEMLLSRWDRSSPGPVAAPAGALSEVELLRPRLTGALSIDTLAEQRSVRGAVALICDGLHDLMEAKVLEYHPAHEEAVALYFDYAHAFSVLNRVDEIGAEMSAMIELITGETPSATSVSEMNFPD